MITIISGTHRKDSLTLSLSKEYFNSLKDKGQEVLLLDFQTLPVSFFYENSIFGTPSIAVENVLKTYIEPADKFVFISPEYNGSYAGVLKAFIDSIHPKLFKGKKACLVGAATGRAGNLRGMDHLTSVLMHIGMHVMPLQIPFSKLDTLLDENQKMNDEESLKLISKHMDMFITY